VLVDVSASLSSAHPNAVAEAFGVLETRPATAVVAAATPTLEQAAFQSLLDGASQSGDAGTDAGGAPLAAATTASVTPASLNNASVAASVPVAAQRVPASQLPKLIGLPLLQQLSLLDRAGLASFASQHGDVLTALAAHPPAAADVSTWWTGVPSARQVDLVKTAPRLVGNLEGVPYQVRDQANRASLVQAEQSLRTQLQGAGRAASADLTRRLHMLEQVRTSLGSGAAGDGRQLVTLDPTGDGTASVVAGDVATADYVTYLVPGMFSSVDSELTTWSAGAARVAADQRAWLQRLTPAGTSVPTTAVVAWFGYHAPTVADVASLAPAREAESALTAEIGGLRALRGDDQPYVTVIAHSYGSTAVLLALQDGDIQVDAVAVVGSPGSPARSVAELGVPGDRVWAGAADADPVSSTALFGTSPTSPSFGAKTLGVGAGTDPLTGATLAAAHLHTDYFAAGTEALRNLELISIGRGDLVIG
jgi:pimeloyl-ACP methyl ester carboxylesterase